MDVLEEALWWAENGVPVFPCNSKKRPMTRNGHINASTDPDEVRAMFDRYNGRDDVLIGARMGQESGLFCVDLDMYKPNWNSAWFDKMVADGCLPPTRSHRTMQGGLHLIYRSDVAWPNVKPTDAVEVKGEGGYIIVPPSRGYVVDEDRPAAIAPAKLITALQQKQATASKETIGGLKQAILEGTDFHDALTRLAAKLAGAGKDRVDVMQVLMETMRASVASNPSHPRHDRWQKIMGDEGKELSRIVGTGHEKFNHTAAGEKAEEVFTPELFARLQQTSAKFGFASPPKGEEEKPKLPPLPEEAPDDWDDPIFAKEGRFAHESLNVLEQKAVIHPILHEMETAIIVAEPKAGKTAVSVTLGLNAACGFSLSPSLQVPSQVGVVYYGLEGLSAIHKRIEAWKQYQTEQGITLPERIPMFIGERSKNLLKEEVRERETTWLGLVDQFFRKKLGIPLGLVVVDTFTKAMPGGDQNSTEITSTVFDIIGKVRDAGLTCSILFIHHKGKTGDGPRGSSNIAAEADVIMSVSKKETDIVLAVDQARSMEEGGAYVFSVKNHLIGTGSQGYEVRAPVLVASDAVVTPIGGDIGIALANKAMLELMASMAAGSYPIEFIATVATEKGIDLGIEWPRRTRVRKIEYDNQYVQNYFEKLIPDTGYSYRGKLFERQRGTAGLIVRIVIRDVG